MRNTIVAGLVLLAAAACGAYQFPGSTPTPDTGTVTGHIVSIPCGPVEQADSNCAGRPAANITITFTSGSSVRSAVTDAQGSYSIHLPAGSWKVGLQTYMRIISGKVAIAVTAGASVVDNFVLDNGIRVPVPQQ